MLGVVRRKAYYGASCVSVYGKSFYKLKPAGSAPRVSSAVPEEIYSARGFGNVRTFCHLPLAVRSTSLMPKREILYNFQKNATLEKWSRSFSSDSGDTFEAVVPFMGESISDGTLVTFLKKPGDRVEVDEPIAQIETDKVTIDVNSPEAGVIKEQPSAATMYHLRWLSSQQPLLQAAATLPSMNDLDFLCRISSLISSQHWKLLQPIIGHNNSSHADFLHRLLCFDNFDSDLIISFFKWSQIKCKVAYSIENHIKLFILLANEKKFPNIRSLLHLFIKQPEPISISSFCNSLVTVSDNMCANSVIFDMLILTLVSNGKAHLAFEGFKRAGAYGFKLSLRSCNSMLAALVRNVRIGNVEFVYKEMGMRKIKMDSITFNTVISGLCKAGRLNKACDIMEDMSAYGVSPTVATYNILIDGYCKRGGAGRMYRADALLEKMVGMGISPSIITYNILIDGFCKDDNVAAGIRLLKEMKEQGLTPSVITYNSLINGLCADGKVDEAISLRDEMVEVGLEPNVVTHSTFINGYSKKTMLKEARELFDDILSNGIAVNDLIFNALINAYCRESKLDEAMAIFNLMLDKKVSPNVSTYNCLIGAYHRDGKVKVVDKLLNEMKEKGLKSDIVTYNIRINAMCKSGETRKAGRLLDEMLKKGLNPTHITYNTLMDGYCKQGDLKAALTVKKRMEKERKWPNVVTYNVLIKAFSERGKLEEANRFLNEMLEKGLVPNQITYDLIKEEMMEKGFVPDIDGHLYSGSGNS